MATRTTYCQCGAMIKLTTDSRQAMEGAMSIWWREHMGDGHGPATKAQALAGRRRNEYHGPAPADAACPVCGGVDSQCPCNLYPPEATHATP